MINKILTIDIQIDFKFWSLFPAININLHSKELEFEWLFLGICATNRKKTSL